ncbi:hypothetical protein RCL1_006261 [Eukaryota sp. TZLM3-RCL]
MSCRYPTLGCLITGLGKPQDVCIDPSQPSLATRIVRQLSDLDLDADHDYSFKVCVIGDAAVGKTTLVNRLTKGEYSPFYHATVNVDYSTQKYVIEGCNVTLQLWDTAGQERSLALTTTYFRNAHAVLLCFDVSSPKSLANIPQWCQRVDDVCTQGSTRPLVFVVGLKTDLRNSMTSSAQNDTSSLENSQEVSLNLNGGTGNGGAWGCVSKHEAGEVAAGVSGEYLEASSRVGDGVYELFDRLAAVLLLRHLEELHKTSEVPVVDATINLEEGSVPKDVEQMQRQRSEGSCSC